MSFTEIGSYVVGTRHFFPISQNSILKHLYGEAFAYMAETQVCLSLFLLPRIII
jgi:hypothetical protein